MSMDILLDTHIAIWAFDDSPKLTDKARELILDGGNRIYVSDVSAWEVAIKHVAHPDQVPFGAQRFADLGKASGFIRLPLEFQAILEYEKLDTSRAQGIHKDPFDRLLIAQSKTSRMLLLTHNRGFSLYDEPLVSIV